MANDRIRFHRCSRAEYAALAENGMIDKDEIYIVNESGVFNPYSMDFDDRGDIYIGETFIGTTSLAAATSSSNGKEGLMSIVDKWKLDHIEEGAQPNVKPNWDASSGNDAEILNKPNIKRQGSSGNQASAIVEGDLDNNIAYGKYSHAEGSSTLTLSEGGHSEGKGTVTESTFKISRKSGTIYVSDIDPTSEISEYSVIEYRDVAKYVSKIEFVDNEWQITLSTAFSSPQPSNSTVNIRRGVSIGTGSHVEGQNCSVIKAYGHAEGLNCMAIGNGAHAEGNSVKATGDYSHSEGRDTLASGNYSHSEGRYSESAGNYAHSEGYNTFAIGAMAHAENRHTMARGLHSHAEGSCAETSSTFTVSAAAGATTYTTNAAHNLVKRQRVAYNGIETYVSTVNSSTSFTVYETLNPDAALQGATIEVLSNHANSQGSHVEGSATVAANLYAHAEGEGTVAYNKAEHAEGRWNYSQDYSTQWPHPKNFLHTIGFGSGADDRRNAVAVMQDGSVFINGIGNVTGEGNPANTTGCKSLQTVLSELNTAAAQEYQGKDDGGHNGVSGRVPIPTGNTLKILTSVYGSEWSTPTDVGLQLVTNKVTSLSALSTDNQYPSAKCVYDLMGDIETALDIIINGNQSSGGGGGSGN